MKHALFRRGFWQEVCMYNVCFFPIFFKKIIYSQGTCKKHALIEQRFSQEACMDQAYRLLIFFFFNTKICMYGTCIKPPLKNRRFINESLAFHGRFIDE